MCVIFRVALLSLLGQAFCLKVCFRSFQAIKPYGRGDDSLFISKKSCDAGVFDGVGSWADLGIDCSKYTRELSKAVANCVQNQRRGAHGGEISMLEALQFGLDKLSSAEVNYSGSSTVCMASLNSEHQVLSLLNIGDSGCLVFRRCKTSQKFRLLRCTHPMVVSYNAPFQIGHLDDKSRNRFSLITGEDEEQISQEGSESGSGSSNNDCRGAVEREEDQKAAERRRKLQALTAAPGVSPVGSAPTYGDGTKGDKRGGGDKARGSTGALLRKEVSAALAREKTLGDLIKQHAAKSLFSSASEADLYDLAVMDGDVVVMGTDGLFDNLFVSEIAAVLDDSLAPGMDEACRGDARAVAEPEERAQGEEEAGKGNDAAMRSARSVEARVQRAVDGLSKRVLGTVFNRSKVTPYTLAHLAYSRQKPTVESALGNLFSALARGMDRDSKGKGESGRGGGLPSCPGDPRNHASREKPGRDFAASYMELDDMFHLWGGRDTTIGGDTPETSPPTGGMAITEAERAQLRREGMMGGKVDDVTIVIGLLHKATEGSDSLC